MISALPKRLRLAFLGRDDHRPSLPLHGEWAEISFFDVAHGWASASEEARRFRPDLAYFLLDGSFDARSAKLVGGLRIGMVTSPPFGATGRWDLDGWRADALDALTWFEPPPRTEKDASATIPLPVDRFGLRGPQFGQRQVVVPRWAAPPEHILTRLQDLDELAVLEPEVPLARHLELLGISSIYVTASYDAAGRLDVLPLHALARGLIVITPSPFPPLWGLEPEEDYLLRPLDQIVSTVEEIKRIPETSRAVRVRAFQKAAEIFDADAVFQRLSLDMLASLNMKSLSSPARLRSVR